MSEGRLVELGGSLRMYASSAIEARFLYEEIFSEGCYDDLDLPARPFVVDVGANIGMFVVFVKRMRPAAEVLAFEPAPQSAELLRRNIELHGLDNVTVRPVALGGVAESDVPFTYYPMIPGNSTRYPEMKELQKANMSRTMGAKVVARMHHGQQISIAVERLSASLRADRPIDLLKLDVEGSEVDVLQGVDAEHWRLVRQVVMEVQDLGNRLASVCQILRGQGLEPVVAPAPLIDAENRTYLVRAARD